MERSLGQDLDYDSISLHCWHGFGFIRVLVIFHFKKYVTLFLHLPLPPPFITLPYKVYIGERERCSDTQSHFVSFLWVSVLDTEPHCSMLQWDKGLPWRILCCQASRLKAMWSMDLATLLCTAQHHKVKNGPSLNQWHPHYHSRP